jgi:tryptophan synthase alpha chain
VRASEAGVHGVLLDGPAGRCDPAREAWIGAGPLAFVRLVAPTTPADRMREIAHHGRGFVYLISRLGVTGMQHDVASDLPETIARLRGATDLPICVGFGVSTGAQAQAIGRLADGIVVGSAIVKAAEAGVDAAHALTVELRRALDSI